jgi:hypothetical protein
MISEAVLGGSNTINQTFTNEDALNLEFPIDFTTSAFEALIPEITNVFGYDLPLTCVFRTNGAPRFNLTQNEITILFSMDIVVFLE